MVGQGVGARTLDVLVLEAADPVELGLVQPVEERLELGLGLARKAHDEGRAQRQFRADPAPGGDLVQRLCGRGGAGHAPQHVRMRMLEGHVEIGQHQPVRHQRNQVAHMRIGIDVVQPHPCAEAAQIAGEVGDMRAVAPFLGVAAVESVGGGVLRDHQQFAHAGFDQPLGLADHRMGGAADEAAAHVGNDAEAAVMVTTFTDFHIGIVTRRQPHARGRQQVHERVGRRRHGGVDRVQHLLVLLGAGDGQHRGMRAGDIVRLGPEAAGDDHPSVLGQRLADRLEAFGLGAVQKAAGVDDDRLRAAIVGADGITLGPQARQDALAVDQGFRTAEADHADGGLAGPRGAVQQR